MTRDAEPELGRFREYLLLLARQRFPAGLQGKLHASDVVQQTLLEAFRDREQLRRADSGQVAVWLRQILVRNLADVVRHQHRAARDVGRERSLEAKVNDSSARLEGWLRADQSSPSQQVQRDERALRVAEALAELPETQREAIVLRHWHELSLAEIAGQLDCTTAAVTGLLHRGLKKLRKLLRDLE